MSTPWTLTAALNAPGVIHPGDTIWLRKGVYSGNFTSYLHGANGVYIKVMAYPGEQVTLDAASPYVTVLEIKGDYSWFQGFEIRNTYANRVVTTAGSNPPGRRGTGVTVYAAYVKVINLVVHDTGDGIGMNNWTVSHDCEVYGNLVYNQGWSGPDRGHGHALYSQSQTGSHHILDNILFGTFDSALNIYGSGSTYLNNFDIEGNLMFRGRVLMGGYVPLVNTTYMYNMTYSNAVELGYVTTIQNTGLVFSNNYVGAGTSLKMWKNAQFSNNTFAISAGIPVGMTLGAAGKLSDYTFNSDHYLETANGVISFVNDTGASYKFPNWNAQGFDRTGSYTQTGARRPTGTAAIFRANRYDANRGHIAVYNWDSLGSVTVDVTGLGLQPGDSYQIRNAQNFYGDPPLTATYLGGQISIPMTAWTAALPIGWSSLLGGPVTFPKFAAFVITCIPSPTAVSVSIAPAGVSLTAGQSAQFTATVLNTSNKAVTWSMNPVNGTLSASGLYTAPASIPTPQTVTIKATSVADPSRSASAVVSLY